MEKQKTTPIDFSEVVDFDAIAAAHKKRKFELRDKIFDLALQYLESDKVNGQDVTKEQKNCATKVIERINVLEKVESIPLPEFVTQREFAAAVISYADNIKNLNEAAGKEKYTAKSELECREYLSERVKVWEADGTADWMREQIAGGNSFALSFETPKNITIGVAEKSGLVSKHSEITDWTESEFRDLFLGRKADTKKDISLTMMPREYNLPALEVIYQVRFYNAIHNIAPSAKIANMVETCFNMMAREEAGEKLATIDERTFSRDILAHEIDLGYGSYCVPCAYFYNGRNHYNFNLTPSLIYTDGYRTAGFSNVKNKLWSRISVG